MRSANIDPAAILNRVLEYAAQNLRIEKLFIQLGLDPTNITYDAVFNRLLDIALANNNGIPVLAESSSGLYEYSPGQDAQVELSKNYDWTKPCPLPARPNKGVGQ